MDPAPQRTSTLTFDSRGSNVWFVLGGILLFIVLVIRFSWYPVVVSDYTYFGKPWFDMLAAHAGLSAFRTPFADYAPLFLYLLKLLTFVPVSSLTSEKTLSLIGDVLIAYFGYRILGRRAGRMLSRSVRFLAGVALFSLPTVMINSSLWGQSDALYAAGILASLYCCMIDAPFLAALAFGAALSLKLQAIFFAPIFVGYVLRKRRGWRYLFIPPAVFLASVIPAVLAGGPPLYWVFIYAHQAGEYPWLSVSAQSAFAYLQPIVLSPLITATAFWIGIAAALALSLWIGYQVVTRDALEPEWLMLVSLAAALLLPYVLPRMHERYFYLADLFSVLYAFYRPRRWWLPVFIVFASLLSYMPFLSGQIGFLSFAHVDLRVPATLLLIPIIFVLSEVVKAKRSPVLQR